MKRTALERKPSQRDWTVPREKVDAEGCCRVCGRSGVKLDAAHIIARSQTAPGRGEVEANIVPLCSGCHSAYDRRCLDLLPFLSVAEQAKAVELAGGILLALRRVTGRRGVVA